MLCVIVVLCTVFASLPASAMTAEEFETACREGTAQTVRELMKTEGFTANSLLMSQEVDGVKIPLIFIATHVGNLSIVEMLLEMGADPNVKVSELNNLNALMYETLKDEPDPRLMTALIKAGANPLDIKNAMIMVFDSTASTAEASSRAATIISDMRGIRSAVLFYYADHLDEENSTMVGRLIGSDPFGDDALGKYIDDPDKFRSGGSVFVTFKEVGGKWWICYAVENDSKVRVKLISRAQAEGLYKSMDRGGGSYDGGDIVYMIAR